MGMRPESIVQGASLEGTVERRRSTAARYCSVVERVHSEYLQAVFDSPAPWDKTCWIPLRVRRSATVRE